MTSPTHSKYTRLRRRLDQNGFKQPFGLDSLSLVEKLFNELVKYRDGSNNTSKHFEEKGKGKADLFVESNLLEITRLQKDVATLNLKLIQQTDDAEDNQRESRKSQRRLEKENNDLRFVNSQYIQQLRKLEEEVQKRSERILQIQEKKTQAIIHVEQKNGGYRPQLMNIDNLLPPAGVHMRSNSPSRGLSRDPLVADVLQVADDRIIGLERHLEELLSQLKDSQKDVNIWKEKLARRDKEIERLNSQLKDCKNYGVSAHLVKQKSLDREISELQQTIRQLDQNLKLATITADEKTSQVAALSTRNSILERELRDIDLTAQKLHANQQKAILQADRQIIDTQTELEKSFHDAESLESEVASLKAENSRLIRLHSSKESEIQRLEGLLAVMQSDRRKLNDRINELLTKENELMLKLESGNKGIQRNMGSIVPVSHWEHLVRSLQEQKDFYMRQADQLSKSLRSGSPTPKALASSTPSVKSRSTSPIRFTRKIEQKDVKSRSTSPLRFTRTSEHSDDYKEEINHLHQEFMSYRPRSPTQPSPFPSIAERAEFRQLQYNLDKLEAEVTMTKVERDSLREKLKLSTETQIAERKRFDSSVAKLDKQVFEIERERAELLLKLGSKNGLLTTLEGELELLKGEVTDSQSQAIATERMKSLAEQTENSLKQVQIRLMDANSEIQRKDAQRSDLERKIGELQSTVRKQQEDIRQLHSNVSSIEMQKDNLHTDIDLKAERMSGLENDIIQKNNTISDLKLRIAYLESQVEKMNERIGGKEGEVKGLRRQLEQNGKEFHSVTMARDRLVGDNRQLIQDLSLLTKEVQSLRQELHVSEEEKERLRRDVQLYVSEVKRIEELLTSKEQDHKRLLEQLTSLSLEATSMETHRNEIESVANTTRMALVNCDSELKHSRDIIMSLEHQLQQKDLTIQEMQQQLEILQAQVSSEQATVTGLEELLNTSRQKEYRIEMSHQEINTEMHILKERVSSLDSKLETQTREASFYRNKSFDVETEVERLKRQLTNEKFERERANQELRKLRNRPLFLTQGQNRDQIQQREITDYTIETTVSASVPPRLYEGMDRTVYHSERRHSNDDIDDVDSRTHRALTHHSMDVPRLRLDSSETSLVATYASNVRRTTSPSAPPDDKS